MFWGNIFFGGNIFFERIFFGEKNIFFEKTGEIYLLKNIFFEFFFYRNIFLGFGKKKKIDNQSPVSFKSVNDHEIKELF